MTNRWTKILLPVDSLSIAHRWVIDAFDYSLIIYWLSIDWSLITHLIQFLVFFVSTYFRWWEFMFMVLEDNNSQIGDEDACTKQMYIGHDENRTANQIYLLDSDWNFKTKSSEGRVNCLNLLASRVCVFAEKRIGNVPAIALLGSNLCHCC